MRLIDGDKAIEDAEHLYNLYVMAMANADTQKEINHIFKRQELFKAVRAVIEHCPAIDPAKHGRWIDVDYETVKCSECEIWINNFDAMSYCPNCGAKMDSDKPITKNLVPLIVKELGLEIGEVFTIRNAAFQYRFTDHWVEQDEGDGKWQPCRDELFIELVVGGEVIDKISDSNERLVDQ